MPPVFCRFSHGCRLAIEAYRAGDARIPPPSAHLLNSCCISLRPRLLGAPFMRVAGAFHFLLRNDETEFSEELKIFVTCRFVGNQTSRCPIIVRLPVLNPVEQYHVAPIDNHVHVSTCAG